MEVSRVHSWCFLFSSFSPLRQSLLTFDRARGSSDVRKSKILKFEIFELVFSFREKNPCAFRLHFCVLRSGRCFQATVLCRGKPGCLEWGDSELLGQRLQWHLRFVVIFLSVDHRAFRILPELSLVWACHTMNPSCNVYLLQGEWQSDLIESKREAGRAAYPVKCLVVLKDEAHVPHKRLHFGVQLLIQISPDFVQPHGLLRSLRWLFTLLT